ncbi:Exosome complex component CSL4 [Fasciola gigantica]|uniref:Exosome complex component CSL4 n=1 Tax=Fasciola gigantica TaxID=46835 RepID=A0A504YNE1_FASGI|nr:Exosome complex component CSL4 [Fasciola gigantica]
MDSLIPFSFLLLSAKCDVQVSSLTRRVVRCDVVAVGDQPLAGPFRGLIRREDIRATQRDQAEPAQSYRPGDLIRARVLNLLGPGAVASVPGDPTSAAPLTNDTLRAAQAVSTSVGATSDASSSASASAPTALCLLTTAEPDLGVVLGLGRTPTSALVDLLGSTAGSPLVPVAWTEMICPHTLTRFPRKVARVPVDLLTQLVRVENE